MQEGLKYKLTASFLLLIFLLNLVAGFACSVGINMGYNRDHHLSENDKSSSPAVHTSHKHGHHESVELLQQEPVPAKPCDDDKDCCSRQVKEFLKLDKNIAGFLILPEQPGFEITGPEFYINKDLAVAEVKSRFQFLRRSCFFNDIAIILAIQSLRI